ncbi:MAG: hypothetical protein PHY45_16650 [Rhodocyclaceae bacterium]|nr:hypothetical protein [Rhodocyclaceae bacterium]
MRTRLAAAALLLAGSSTAALAAWTQAYASAGYTSYYDAATVRKDGQRATLWQLRDLKSPASLAGKAYRSQRAQLEYDCTERRVRMRAIALYAAPMGAGETVADDDHPGEWNPIDPDSMNDAFLRIACGKQP